MEFAPQLRDMPLETLQKGCRFRYRWWTYDAQKHPQSGGFYITGNKIKGLAGPFTTLREAEDFMMYHVCRKCGNRKITWIIDELYCPTCFKKLPYEDQVSEGKRRRNIRDARILTENKK